MPTADEWEKAARGTTGDWWPWGDGEPYGLANFRLPGATAARESDASRTGGDLEPVGSFPDDRSAYDVWDMAGNVMEWVDSWYGPDRREIRGGSWNTGSYHVRAANRAGRAASEVFFDVGFRCAYDVKP